MGHGEIVFPSFLQGKISFRRRIPPSIYPYGNYSFDLEFDISMIELLAWFKWCL